MTTTELINLLKQYEFGASNRPREITIHSHNVETNEHDVILKYTDTLILNGTGDGIAGAEINLLIKQTN